MDDWFYPDNPNREKRMYELVDDIGTLMNDLVNYAVDIRRLFAKVDAIVRGMYSHISVPIPPSHTKSFEYHGWVLTMTDILEGLITPPIVQSALQKCAVAWLLREGRILDAGFYNAIEGLEWLKIGVTTGVIVFTVGLNLGTDAITGAVKRKKLRDAIHSAVQPRIQLKKAAIINGMLRDQLKTFVDACELMKQLGYTQQQLDEAQRKIAAKFVTEVSKVTEQTAKTELGDLDRTRGSWTNEDFK